MQEMPSTIVHNPAMKITLFRLHADTRISFATSDFYFQDRSVIYTATASFNLGKP
jgi:hypothetical protein